jgi:hypothetical protein
MSNNGDQMGDLMDKVNSLSDLERQEEARQQLEKARIILEEKYNQLRQAVPETGNGN